MVAKSSGRSGKERNTLVLGVTAILTFGVVFGVVAFIMNGESSIEPNATIRCLQTALTQKRKNVTEKELNTSGKLAKGEASVTVTKNESDIEIRRVLSDSLLSQTINLCRESVGGLPPLEVKYQITVDVLQGTKTNYRQVVGATVVREGGQDRDACERPTDTNGQCTILVHRVTVNDEITLRVEYDKRTQSIKRTVAEFMSNATFVFTPPSILRVEVKDWKKKRGLINAKVRVPNDRTLIWKTSCGLTGFDGTECDVETLVDGVAQFYYDKENLSEFKLTIIPGDTNLKEEDKNVTVNKDAISVVYGKPDEGRTTKVGTERSKCNGDVVEALKNSARLTQKKGKFRIRLDNDGYAEVIEAPDGVDQTELTKDPYPGRNCDAEYPVR